MNNLIGFDVPKLKNVVYYFRDFTYIVDFFIVIQNNKVSEIIWWYKDQNPVILAHSTFCSDRSYIKNRVKSIYFEDILDSQTSLAKKILGINIDNDFIKNVPHYISGNYEKDFPALKA